MQIKNGVNLFYENEEIKKQPGDVTVNRAVLSALRHFLPERGAVIRFFDIDNAQIHI